MSPPRWGEPHGAVQAGGQPEALKLMVAEEIFTRWPVPHAGADTHPELRDYRSRWSSAARHGQDASRSGAVSAAPLGHDPAHDGQDPRPPERGRARLWRVAGSGARAAGDGGVPLHRRGRHGVFGGWGRARRRPDRATEEAQVEAEFAQGMYALIVGALAVLEQREPFDPALFRRGNRPGAMKTPPGSLRRRFAVAAGRLSPAAGHFDRGSRTAS